MMGSCGQTIVKYQGTALPLNGVAVDLFNSAVAFANVNTPSGGSFHLLGLQWFQYTLRFGSAGAATGVVIGEFSDDKGANWLPFYDSSAAGSFGAAFAINTTVEDEVYVGMFKDVRFRFTASVADTNAFSINLALNPHKATSKAHGRGDPVTTADTIGGNL